MSRAPRRRRNFRRGSALVELAVCVPLIASVTLLSIDFSNKIYDQETLQIAAYEAARVASRPNASRDKAISRATDVLTSRGITNVDIDILPPSFSGLQPGDVLEVVLKFQASTNKTPAEYLLTKPQGVSAKYVRQ